VLAAFKQEEQEREAAPSSSYPIIRQWFASVRETFDAIGHLDLPAIWGGKSPVRQAGRGDGEAIEAMLDYADNILVIPTPDTPARPLLAGLPIDVVTSGELLPATREQEPGLMRAALERRCSALGSDRGVYATWLSAADLGYLASLFDDGPAGPNRRLARRKNRRCVSERNEPESTWAGGVRRSDGACG
jgi:hypothetical protein